MRLLRLQSLQVDNGGMIFPKRFRASIARKRKLLLGRGLVFDLELGYSTVIVSLADLICILGRGPCCGRRHPTDEQFSDGLRPILELTLVERSGQRNVSVSRSSLSPGHRSPDQTVALRIGKSGRLVVIRGGILEIAFQIICIRPGEIVVRHDAIGLRTIYRLVFREGGVLVGSKLDGVGEILDRFVQAVLGYVDLPATEPACGTDRIEVDRIGQRRDRAGEVALFGKGKSEFVMSEIVLRVEPDCLEEVGFGRIDMTERKISETTLQRSHGS